jgi:hypothetical protein
MDKINPTSENSGNIVNNIHNKNTTQRTKKEASSAREG